MNKLQAYWSKKEQDILLKWPRYKCDGHYLSGIFDKEFEKQMDERGFDITTMRFSIREKESR